MSKFKVGDKVKIIKLLEYSYCFKVGDIGVVVGIENDEFPIRLKINNEDDYSVKEDEIEIVKERTPLSEYHIDELLAEVRLRTKQYNEY